MKQNAKNQLVGSLLLLICAFIWGSAFVAQTTGAEHVGPFTFIYLRSFLGGIVLLPVIFFMGKIRKKSPAEGAQLKKNRKTLLTGGLACGVALCFASVFQQAGIDKGTDPGKAGFITALYILLVPYEKARTPDNLALHRRFGGCPLSSLRYREQLRRAFRFACAYLRCSLYGAYSCY